MNVSYLYTPALRIDSLVAKRDMLRAHAIVFDLEDSTHINAKAAAREKVWEFDFSPLVELGVKLGIRINALSSYEGLEDLRLLQRLYARGGCPLEFVLLPKVNHPSEVKLHRSLFRSLPTPPHLYTFIETVEAVENADAIASVSDALCFGQADLVAELYAPNQAYIDYARARMCIAAARARIQAIDTNSFEISDMARFESECVAAKAYGFTGKAAIHPTQVAAINRIFSISQALLHKYQSVVDTYVRSDTGFALLDGEVIAPPFVAKARRMLEIYGK